MLATLELTVRRLSDGSHSADARLTSMTSAAATTLAANVPITLDQAALIAASINAAAYGALLSQYLFADARLRDTWLKARAYAAADTLQFRLNLDASEATLHALRWETLRDPETDQPIALHERVRLVCTLDSINLTPVVIPPRPDLRALVVISNPSNLGYGNDSCEIGPFGRFRPSGCDLSEASFQEPPCQSRRDRWHLMRASASPTQRSERAAR